MSHIQVTINLDHSRPRVVVSTAAFHAKVGGSVPGLGGLKETKMFLPHPRVKVSIVGSLRDREVACSTSDRQGSNFEFCVWRTVSSQSSHHPQEVLLAKFSLYVHKGGLKPDSFHSISTIQKSIYSAQEYGPYQICDQLTSPTPAWQLTAYKPDPRVGLQPENKCALVREGTGNFYSMFENFAEPLEPLPSTCFVVFKLKGCCCTYN